jgi:hypothetical protein
MSRTYRRRGARYEYRSVLCDWVFESGRFKKIWIDARSAQGRRAVARFHSDAETTMRSGAPRWYRRRFDHQLRTLNDRELRRWIDDWNYDPVQQARHRHTANWSWW